MSPLLCTKARRRTRLGAGPLAMLLGASMPLQGQPRPLVERQAAQIYQRLLRQSSRAQTAAATALAEMVSAREMTDAQAMTLARGYLHDNAAALYRPDR